MSAACPGSLSWWPFFRNSAESGSNSKGPKVTFGALEACGRTESPGEAMVTQMISRTPEVTIGFFSIVYAVRLIEHRHDYVSGAQAPTLPERGVKCRGSQHQQYQWLR